MAYDEELADRIRECVAGESGIDEKRMFGGLAFLIGGHIAVSASGRGGLMLRCEPADTDTHVAQDHVERMVMRGREMDGWLRVAPDGVASDDALTGWVRIGVAYARSLPAK